MTSPRPSRPGAPLLGALIAGVGLTIAISAVLAAVVGTEAPTTSPTTRAADGPGPDSPQGASDPERYQVVRSKDGAISFEAPVEWGTLVDVAAKAGSDSVSGTGAVSTTFDDYKAAKTDGIVGVITGTGEATSPALAGAVIGNSSVFCPPTKCTTGTPTELTSQLDSPVTQAGFQFTFSTPAADGEPGELRYTIETPAPTRYIVMIVRAADPQQGADAMEHALATLQVD